MMHINTTQKKAISSIGEEIGLELGLKFISDFQQAFPNEIPSFVLGREIMDQILSQPGCEGIQFFMGLNEKSEKTLVYIGLDRDGNAILSYSQVTVSGAFETQEGIVADRIDRGGGRINTGTYDTDNGNWSVE